MDIKEIRNKSVSELNNILNDLRNSLDDLKFKSAQDQIKNIREIRVVKRTIARILMTLKEKSTKN